MQKILVVDDEDDIREVITQILKSHGYDVVVAKNADECLKQAKKEKPDLILLDILMPGTSVNDILPKLIDIKVIIFSVIQIKEQYVAETGRKYPTKQLFSNIVDTIHKPIKSDVLISKIKKVLS
jgi:CheY-like chemotaxis protein